MNFFKLTILLYMIFLVVLFRGNAQTLIQMLNESTEYISNNEYSKALEIIQSVESQCLTINNDSIKVVFNKNCGRICFKKRDYANAIRYLEQVPSIFERLNQKGIDYLDAFLFLGMANQYIGKDSIAENYYRKGILKTMFLNETENYRPSFYLHLGNLYTEKGDSILASACYKQIDPQKYSLLIGVYNDESQALEFLKNGKFEQALVLYDKIIARIKQIIGITNNEYARAVFSKALVLSDFLNRKEDALSLYEEIICMKNYIGECSVEYLESLCKYLQLLAYFGNETQLKELLPEVILTMETCKNQYWTLALLYRLIGNGAFLNERYKLAIPFYEKYIEEGGDEVGQSKFEIQNMLAVSYLHSNNPKKALSVLKELSHKKELDCFLDLKVTILHNLGRTLMLLGKKTEALKYLIESNNLYHQQCGKDNPRTLQYINECDK